ncbi:MAG: Ldh family oxidoreductase [candidate division NC10 bacterium]|nr:Ldh family oxidoreductase [candidate division NC10 bacterium]
MQRRDGRIDPRALPQTVGEGPAWAVVDGRRGMPTVIAFRAMALAMRKAKAAGIAYGGVRGSNHFGAAGYYAVMALKEDMIGMAMTNTDPWMTLPGGCGPILGTNPIAFVAIDVPAMMPVQTSGSAWTA